jgi:hypothetical protein
MSCSVMAAVSGCAADDGRQQRTSEVLDAGLGQSDPGGIHDSHPHFGCFSVNATRPFLEPGSAVGTHVRPRRPLLPAELYSPLGTERFQPWREVVGLAATA